jgi:exodeoxyribonuclease VII large subunit
MTLAKRALEGVVVRVMGEVSECTVKPGYKAVYFTLADEDAVMPCLMWRDAYATCGVDLRAGMLVEVAGAFSAYLAKGRLQFQVRSVTLAGEGALRVQVAELARRLEAEGLMARDRKRPLPAFPQRIGVVTSPRGKAVHDIIRTLRRRYPMGEVVVAGVQVEGEGSVDALVAGLRLLTAEEGVEVIVIGRGGGSYEDLMPFNAEALARAIAASPIPVVTGIGHEPDTTLADMVADVRASTPTAAAEAVSPKAEELAARLDSSARLLGRALLHVVHASLHRVRIVEANAVFRDAVCLLATNHLAADAAADGLARALPLRLQREMEALQRVGASLAAIAPRLAERRLADAASSAQRLSAIGTRMMDSATARWELGAARLADLSPLATLARGFAVCTDAAGRLVRSAVDVAEGDLVAVRLEQGSIGCVVESTGMEE